MSKYQPRIILNNPEKNVPANIVEQFFLMIRNGDIDKIRDFANQNKLKYNLIEKGAKGSPSESGKTPFHVVLELDDKIANSEKKLRLMQFLDQMGAPMDLPDSADVWPIHLATGLQSEKLVDFLLKKKVIINRKDSSNNTPLHYAVIGRETVCPRPVTIGAITPVQKAEKRSLNKTLEDVNKLIIDVLSKNPRVKSPFAPIPINDNLIHIINTIMRIPEMYAETKDERNLQNDIINIFTNVALNPTYQEGSTTQQRDLEQLVERTYATINDGLLKGLTNPLSIAPNNGGWGPTIPVAGGTRPPNNLERILADNRAVMMRNIDNEYTTRRAAMTNISTAMTTTTVKVTIPGIISKLDSDYIDKLIFCTDCKKSDYGEDITFYKMLILLVWNEQFRRSFIDILNSMGYVNNLINKFLSQYKLMNELFKDQIVMLARPENRATNEKGYLMFADMTFLLENLPNANDIDLSFAKAIHFLDTSMRLNLNNCIRENLNEIILATNKDYFVENIHKNLNKPILAVLLDPKFIDFGPLYNKLRDEYKDDLSTWLEMLTKLIVELQPKPKYNPENPGTYDFNNIFYDEDQGYVIPDAINLINPENRPNFISTTGLPIRTEHTYLDALRIISIIGQYLTKGNFQMMKYPKFFDLPISSWEDYFDGFGNQPLNIEIGNGLVKIVFPEYIFLAKILVRVVRLEIETALNKCLASTKDTIKNNYNTVYTAVSLINDVDMYNILMPSRPDRGYFDNMIKEYYPYLKNNRWNNIGKNNSLAEWFSVFSKTNNIMNDLFNTLGKPIRDITNDPTEFDKFNPKDYNTIREYIENGILNYSTQMDSIIQDNKFKNYIERYFGTYSAPASKKPKYPDIETIDILPKFNNMTNIIVIDDMSEENLIKLRNKTLLPFQFLAEFYAFNFIVIKLKLLHISDMLNGINKIISHSIIYINSENYYYIPQIFFPALVREIIVTVENLIDIRLDMDNLNKIKAILYAEIDMGEPKNASIITLGDNFIEYVNTQLKTIYTNVIEIIKYHNDMINFINYHSAYKLIGKRPHNYLFTMNLIPLESFPDIFMANPNFDILLNVLRLYRIPEIKYYAGSDSKEFSKLKLDIFDHRGEPGFGKRYEITTYLDIINLERTGIISNSPTPGENLQINFTITKREGMEPLVTVYNVKAINGEWLNFDPNVPLNTTYFDAFIGYRKNDFVIDNKKWLDGMPPSIRELAGIHLRMMKQRIIEETLQYIIDYKDIDESNPLSTKKIYNRVKNLANEPTYSAVSEVKVYVVLAKQIDSILNTIISHAIRQSIANWIKIYSTGGSYPKLVNEIDEKVNIVKQPNYIKIYFPNIDKEAAEKMLEPSSEKYIDFRLAQIEPNPVDIKYSIEPTPKDLIHYLYDIDYLYPSVTTTNKKCYKINPKIAEKLITPDTINARNSDGQTPLHMAVNIHHDGLVELLMSRGANAHSFKNNRNKSPFEMAIERTLRHTRFIDGQTVIDSINNFVLSFNDLLLGKLRDEKYANNIIKNITLAVPIQLVMYNHMFNLFLGNYRYNFTFELKNKIAALFQKYFGKDLLLYPTDLFEINDLNKLSEILSMTDPKNRFAANISGIGRKRFEEKQKLLDMINNQLTALKKEKNNTDDAEQRLFVDEIIEKLEKDKTKTETEMSKLQGDNITRDTSSIAVYAVQYSSIIRKFGKRNVDITNFYNEAFGALGMKPYNEKSHRVESYVTNEVALGIWNNYLNKNLSETPSMIFSLCNKIINIVVQQQMTVPLNADAKNELNTLVDFFRVVKNYIDSKTSLPSNLEDNPILKQEFEQIVYLINLIITPAVRNIILNQIYDGLKMMDATEVITKNQNEILSQIIGTEFNGQTIDRYLYEKLPWQAVKYYTTTYESDTDIDRRTTTGNDLFLPLIQIIKSNKIILINDESVLVQNFRDYLIPFLVNTYQNFITYLRLAVYGYEKYLLNTYQLLKIIQHMV